MSEPVQIKQEQFNTVNAMLAMCMALSFMEYLKEEIVDCLDSEEFPAFKKRFKQAYQALNTEVVEVRGKYVEQINGKD
tara:strand:+ start:2095 stop:2328 length:234 start_codon:yes stop_codon:yes gene_type:complete